MFLKFSLLLICGISIVSSIPPLQVKDTKRVGDLFHREHRINSKATRYRLPTNIIPEHYTVNIRPILDVDYPDSTYKQFDAPGDVVIRVKCVQATNTITLHSIEIEIEEASVKVTDVDSGADIGVVSPGESDEENETYTIKLSQSLEEEKLYNIAISFKANVLEELRGLYRSSYTNSDGFTRWLATTQFEDIDARRAFPCFDEPAMKATFDMNVAYNKNAGYLALCNMDIVDDTPDTNPQLTGWWWSKFRTSVKMPTYLVAIVVSDFIAEEAPAGSFGDKPVKTWGQKDLMEHNQGGAYSANITAVDLTFYEQYFDQAYELPKMDSVAIPDFPFGAMENWGLITYREDYLLYFPGETTEAQRQRVTTVIAHEVAHQWFGNIVTMEFWNDIWLNEGLSTYVERLGTSVSDPEFDSLNTDAIDAVQLSMAFDAGAATFPVSSPDDNPSRIIYEKGSSVVRMMQAFLTEETLKRGLREYIKEKRYGNAVQDDLFRVLNVVAQEDGNLPNLSIKEVMDTWTLQTGYPLVRVSKASSSRIFVSQERFKYQKLVSYINPEELWWIPVTYTSATTPTLPNHKPKLWIPKNTMFTSHSVDVNLNSDWILVNPDANGFYRVLYDVPLTNLLKAQLDRDASVFSSTSRSQLLDDYFTLAFNDYTTIQSALDFTTYLGKEDTLVAWKPVLKHLDMAYRLFSGTVDDFTALKGFFSEKLEKALVLIGPEQDPIEKGVSVILRANLLDWACGFETETCRLYANKLYSQWVSTPATNPIPVDVRPAIQCAIIYMGGGEELAFMEEQFEGARNPTDKRMLLNSLACSSNTTYLESALQSAFTNEVKFSKEEAKAFINRVAANSVGRNIAFNFLEREVERILAYLDNDTSIVKDLFGTFAQYFNKLEHVERMQTFVSAHSSILPGDDLQLHIQKVSSNVDWMNRYGTDIVNWFNTV